MNTNEEINEFFQNNASQRRQNVVLDEFQRQLQSIQNVVYLLQEKCTKQQQQIDELKKEKHMSLSRKRKIILEYINKPFWPKPSTTFETWIRNISINRQDLKHMFEHDLVNGIKHCLERYCNIPLLPICCFIQKPNTIYIWSNDISEQPKWILLDTNKYETWLNRMSHLFLQTFLQWQMDNSETLQSNEEEKEKNISYMHKINGLGDKYEKKRHLQLRNWIYDTFSREFEIQEYV